MMSLAHCYSHGTGVEQDYQEAFNCHNAAAEKGQRNSVMLLQ